MPQLEEIDLKDTVVACNFQNDSDFYTEIFNSANAEQKQILTSVVHQIENNNISGSKCHFIDAAAGTGKTYVLDGICVKAMEKFKDEKCIAVVCSTAIGVQQLKYKATTAHYKFKLPIHFMDPNTISVGLNMQDDNSKENKHLKC